MLQDEIKKVGGEQICPAAVIVRNNSILLGLRNYTKDKWKDISVWTTPGGRCDKDETIEAALKREVYEEVGITDLQIIDLIGEMSGAKDGDKVPIFFCKSNQDAKLMEPEKFSKWEWIPINEYIKGEPYNVMNPKAHKLISDYLKNKFR